MSPEDRKLNIGEVWRLVERDLVAARRNLEIGLPHITVTQSCYASFHAARALLLSDGSEPSTHAGVRTELQRLFGRSGRIPAEVVRSLTTLQQEREDTDYTPAPDPTPEAAARSLHDAEHFCAVAREWLRGAGWLA